MNYLQTIAKAIVPMVVGLVLLGLSHLGLTPQMTLEQATTLLVGSLVTSVGVWATPNKA